MTRKILLFSLLNLFAFVYSQGREVFVGKEVQTATTSKKQADVLGEMFYDYKVFKINSAELVKFVENKDLSLFTLALGNAQSFDIDLEPNPVFSANYERIVNGVSTKSIYQKPKNITYKGKSGEDNIAMTLTKGGITAYIKGKNESYYIEPLKNVTGSKEEDLYILYSEKDVKPSEHKCGLTETQKQTELLGKSAKVEASTDQKGCVTINIALAAAYDMVEFYGSADAVETKMAALINGVNVDYATVFNKTIKFSIVSSYISDGATSSLDTALGTGDVAGAFLGNFTNWSKSGNLSPNSYDVGLLYFKRQMQRGIVGLAGVGTFCSGSNYLIVRDYRDNFSLIRNVTSHELGHTFGCGHTAGIMAPVSSESSEWDQPSINVINNKEASTSCNQGQYALQGTATAAFTLAATACKNEIIALNAAESRGSNNYNWSALGANTSSGSEQKFSTSYATEGNKTITLETSNNFTCEGNIATDTISKNIQILDLDAPAVGNCNYQTSNRATSSVTGTSPTRVVFGTIDRRSPSADLDKKVYDDNVCIHYTTVTEGDEVPIIVEREFGGNPTAVRVWIDFNNDGVFDNNTETVINIQGNANQANEGVVKIPAEVEITGRILRMRVVTDYGGGYVTNPCSTNYGQIEDYGVIIQNKTLSTNEQNIANEITLVNNPISNTAEFALPNSITNKKIKIHAYDMSGKWIATQTLQNNSGRAVLPTSDWQKGMYLFIIEYDGKMQKTIKALK